METITTHLRDGHYWLAIACNICKTFAGMSAQVILEHHSGCKLKSHKKKSKVKQQEKNLLKSTHMAPINPAGQKMPENFCSILPMNEGCCSHSNLAF